MALQLSPKRNGTTYRLPTQGMAWQFVLNRRWRGRADQRYREAAAELAPDERRLLGSLASWLNDHIGGQSGLSSFAESGPAAFVGERAKAALPLRREIAAGSIMSKHRRQIRDIYGSVCIVLLDGLFTPVAGG